MIEIPTSSVGHGRLFDIFMYLYRCLIFLGYFIIINVDSFIINSNNTPFSANVSVLPVGCVKPLAYKTPKLRANPDDSVTFDDPNHIPSDPPHTVTKTEQDYEFIDEYGLKIPKFSHRPGKLEEQLMYHGPTIPDPLWKKPERPVGFFGRNKMAPEGTFINMTKRTVVKARKKKYMRVIYYFVRKEYKHQIKIARNEPELMYWQYKLDALPKDSSKTKYRNYCMLTGRMRSYYGFFGLGRHTLRDFVNRGFVPGVFPASW